MSTYEFLKRLEDAGFKWFDTTQDEFDNRDVILIDDIKEKRLLAKVSKTEPYCFEFTNLMQQEFWAEHERADDLVQLVLAYTRTDPNKR